MQEHFEIRPSRLQLGLLIAGHLVLALAVGVYVEPGTIRMPAVALILLLGVRETKQEIDRGKFVLRCDPRSGNIALQCGEQPYFYRKYKVTSWISNTNG